MQPNGAALLTREVAFHAWLSVINCERQLGNPRGTSRKVASCQPRRPPISRTLTISSRHSAGTQNDFFGTEDLLKQHLLPKTIMADYPRFQEICGLEVFRFLPGVRNLSQFCT